MSTILGLDLSLSGSGMIALPLAWMGDWGRLARATVGERPNGEVTEAWRIGRLVRIASAICEFARRHEVSHVFLEGYAFDQVLSRAHSIGELGGVVKHELAKELGLVCEIVAVNTARKTLLGCNPRRDGKKVTRAFVEDCGMPHDWTGDEADAFVIANHGASLLGGWAMVSEPIAPKAKRRRAS